MLGIIRVLTTENQDVLKEHENILKRRYAIQAVTSCISDQPNGIYNDQSEKEAIPKIIELSKQMLESNELDCITISCAADPGLNELKEIHSIPILGAGIAGATLAKQQGKKIAVIGITDLPPKVIQEMLGTQLLVYVFEPTIRKTTDLFKEEAKSKLLRRVKTAQDEGADVILFACTGFSTIQLKNFLEEHIRIPIIDLVEAQGELYLQMKKENSL